jgi:hypothetical protein
MQEFYGEHRRMLATKLVLFDVFLKRSDTVPEVDKEKVLQKMDQFADLIAQSPFVQKQSAKARMEGKEPGLLLLATIFSRTMNSSSLPLDKLM